MTAPTHSPINPDAPQPVWLPAELWDTIQDSVPIVCVDVAPVLRDDAGEVTHVGFIQRTAPFSEDLVWCHIGGRVNLGESLAGALRRHLLETLGEAAVVDLGPDPQPAHVMQYFRNAPDPDSAHGWDPRKHAVGLTYVATIPAHAAALVAAVAGGEGASFAWFPVADLPPAEVTWPGSLTAVKGALRSAQSEH